MKPFQKNTIPADVMAWLDNYTGDFGFYLSVRQQAVTKGTLSDKQIDAIRRAIQRENAKAAQSQTPQPANPNAMVQVGDLVEIGRWVARRVQEQLELQTMFRNVRIEEVLRETAKAFQVRVSFVAKVCNHCHICGLELDTEISRATGIGPVCAKNIGIKRHDSMTASEILAEINRICREVGTIGPFWLPKSQIKQVDRLPTGPSLLERA